ncbi:DNA-binding transcriptional regulator, MarR family [Paenibacillus sp. UNCCL117]|uniref:MarR family winged helix-turn-helix transcriptional regulator n=1 Tax=unclassified Paenibacillus TaxID=185978 RepID=UPI00088B90B7|nr:MULTISPECIES: MarR family transcriptional regulator [unclassified Paenibacillus]SDE37560.1 DNA-binding transcriptional regulator, MarR family [Paenibacillus sp. cl123]SFW64961.1 DNA-binding transcriptional regulator, MarR family [Paenibacillus sp. UNCCL117]
MMPEPSSESIGFLIGQTHRKMANLLSIRLREHDITTEQFSVLYRLHDEDGISQKEIAARSVKDQPTIARILDCLIRKNLVRKEINQNDRRSFQVYLTLQGREKIELMIPIENMTLQDIFGDMEAAELDMFRQIHERLQDRLGLLLEEGERS